MSLRYLYVSHHTTPLIRDPLLCLSQEEVEIEKRTFSGVLDPDSWPVMWSCIHATRHELDRHTHASNKSLTMSTDMTLLPYRLIINLDSNSLTVR